MRLQSPGLWVGRYGDSSGRGGVPEIQGWVDGKETKKNAREEKRGSERGVKPAAEKGHGKPQKLITDINTLTPWTLLLMYFLPFRPTGAHSIYRAGGAAAYRENFSPKKPSFPYTHTHTQQLHRILPSILFVYTCIYIYTHTHTPTHTNVVERAFSAAAFSRSAAAATANTALLQHQQQHQNTRRPMAAVESWQISGTLIPVRFPQCAYGAVCACMWDGFTPR